MEVLEIPAERHTRLYPCCPDPYIDITFNLTLRRRVRPFSTVQYIRLKLVQYSVLYIIRVLHMNVLVIAFYILSLAADTVLHSEPDAAVRVHLLSHSARVLPAV